MLEVAGAEDGAVVPAVLRTSEDTTDLVVDRLDVLTVVLAPTIGVGRPEDGNTGDAELRLPIGYGIGPPVGIGVAGVAGTGVAEPTAGTGVV